MGDVSTESSHRETTSFAHLCDYAIVSADGKLSVMGIFTNINVAQLPAAHTLMCLAFQIDASYAEADRDFTIELSCVDADGDQVFTMRGKARFQAERKRPGERMQSSQVLTMQNLLLRRTGAYDINIFLDGALKHTVCFTVTRTGPDPDTATQ